jgi:hypothetical protein
MGSDHALNIWVGLDISTNFSKKIILSIITYKVENHYPNKLYNILCV